LGAFHIDRKFICNIAGVFTMLLGTGSALLLISWMTVVNAGTCKTGRIFLGNINETFPMHLNKIGVYTRLPDRTLFNRPVFRHEGSGQYLYYRRGAINLGLWVVGPEVGSDSASFSIQSEQADPSLIRLGVGKAWSIQTDEGWVREPKLMSVCVDESFGECNTDILNLVFYGPTLQHHRARTGLYDRQEETLNLRPVYKHRDNGEYLYYHMGMWIIGPEVGSATMSLFSLDYAFRPELIVQPWISLYHFELGNAQLKILCHGREGAEVPSSTTPTTEGLPEGEEGFTNTSQSLPSEEEVSPTPPRNPCLSNPCQHGGTCVPGESGTFTCVCTAAYTGPHCNEVSCGPPPVAIVHGRLRRVTSQGVLGLAYYSCDDGYVSSTGHMIAMCGHSRRWVDLPSCVPSLNQLLEPLASVLRE
jgi:hypothetical protein